MTFPIYTAAKMRAYELQAVENGTPFLQLMENAGQGAARDILQHFPHPAHALIVCGKGNNGGDGLVIARVLAEQGWQVDVILALGEKLSELAEINRQRLPFPVNYPDDLPDILSKQPDIIIDAVFGTGFTGALPTDIAEIFKIINRTPANKIALDLPSGLATDSGKADKNTFRADVTYSFAARKPAHVIAPEHCGEIVCIPIT